MNNNIINIEIDLDEVTDEELEFLEKETIEKHSSLEHVLLTSIKEHVTQSKLSMTYTL